VRYLCRLHSEDVIRTIHTRELPHSISFIRFGALFVINTLNPRSASYLENKVWNYPYNFLTAGLDNIFGIATCNGLDIRGSNTGGALIFRTLPDRPWSPYSLLCNGYRVSCQGAKRLGRGVDQPPPSSAEVKEEVEIYISSSSVIQDERQSCHCTWLSTMALRYMGKSRYNSTLRSARSSPSNSCKYCLFGKLNGPTAHFSVP